MGVGTPPSTSDLASDLRFSGVEATRCYWERSGVYPPPLKPQSNDTFNYWPGYAADRVELELDADTIKWLAFFLEHLNMLLNRDVKSFEFVLDWLAHAVQYPAIKVGIMLCFLGDRRIGKTAVWNMIVKVFGKAPALRQRSRTATSGARATARCSTRTSYASRRRPARRWPRTWERCAAASPMSACRFGRCTPARSTSTASTAAGSGSERLAAVAVGGALRLRGAAHAQHQGQQTEIDRARARNARRRRSRRAAGWWRWRRQASTRAEGATAPSRRSARDRGAAAPAYADHMGSDSDDADADFDEGEAGVDDDDE